MRALKSAKLKEDLCKSTKCVSDNRAFNAKQKKIRRHACVANFKRNIIQEKNNKE